MGDELIVGDWRVTARTNKSGNLSIEVDRLDEPHAEVILQDGGTVDLLTKARRQMDLGSKGWDAPRKPGGFRRFRFEENGDNA